ncbi:YHYH protein [Stieleria marina]|uniref:YHYH domain-containing protein n=1 Tax=Stieleria marina TaxID=1930275 RepID=A0A517NXX4_9BACT|nr:hypothetical protein K239x_39830 [Planctomycetes bacterium K23_9]
MLVSAIEYHALLCGGELTSILEPLETASNLPCWLAREMASIQDHCRTRAVVPDLAFSSIRFRFKEDHHDSPEIDCCMPGGICDNAQSAEQDDRHFIAPPFMKFIGIVMRYRLLVRFIAALFVCGHLPAMAHDGHTHSSDGEHHAQPVSRSHQRKVKAINTQPTYILTSFNEETEVGNQPDKKQPEMAGHFRHFKNVTTRWNADTLFVQSNGLPDHNMMVGIRSWQQQVPLPQPYTGKNAWQIPLKPKLAANPVSAKHKLYRGAIALAVNGVPIFNALNNRGDDAFLAGELDQWGGHCGRGDDYHYHIAPIHLETIVGKGEPIAYALDGFPIYGPTEADGSPVGKLDQFNGQFDRDGAYHYHATTKYPYINGGMRGEVTIRGDQIDPQPRDSPLRPALQPLRGARITEFEATEKQSKLTYSVQGRTGTVTYFPVTADDWKFTFKDPDGRTRTESYQRRTRDDRRGDDRRGDDRRPPPAGGKRPPPPPRR